MQKIDYLENKVNELLYEVNYLKSFINKDEELKQKIVTENFILNSNLEINTFNKNSYESLAQEETESVDKWILFNGASYVVNEKKLTLPSMGEFKQIITNERLNSLKNKTVTLTANIKEFTLKGFSLGCKIYLQDETILKHSIIVEKDGISSVTFYVPEDAIKIECFLLGSDNLNETEVVLLWFKLEIGSYFTNYVLPTQIIEKIKCCNSGPILSEIIYDKDSLDANINFGFTSGLKGTDEFVFNGFNKYKRLKIYMIFNNKTNHVEELSLIKPNPEKTEIYADFRLGHESGSYSINYCIIRITDMIEFKNLGMGYFTSTTKNVKNSNANYYIYKIEGLY